MAPTVSPAIAPTAKAAFFPPLASAWLVASVNEDAVARLAIIAKVAIVFLNMVFLQKCLFDGSVLIVDLASVFSAFIHQSFGGEIWFKIIFENIGM